MSSVAKKTANRRNAQLSTGPKTATGKSLVKWNALKHGLLSREIVIREGDGCETPAEYNAMLEGLRTDLMPFGTLEEMLVERIAVCYWRLRRAIRAEVGETRRRTDSARWRQMFELTSKVRENERFVVLEENREQFERSSLGQQRIIENLDVVRSEVEEKGFVSVESLKEMAKFHGTSERSIVLSLGAISSMAKEGLGLQEPMEGIVEQIPNPDRCKEILLQMIDEAEKRHDGFRQEFEQIEQLQIEARQLSYSLPPQESIDKILRYETAIERQLYRAIDQLERIQRARSGHPIPPPLNISVSTGD